MALAEYRQGLAGLQAESAGRLQLLELAGANPIAIALLEPQATAFDERRQELEAQAYGFIDTQTGGRLTQLDALIPQLQPLIEARGGDLTETISKLISQDPSLNAFLDGLDGEDRAIAQELINRRYIPETEEPAVEVTLLTTAEIDEAQPAVVEIIPPVEIEPKPQILIRASGSLVYEENVQAISPVATVLLNAILRGEDIGSSAVRRRVEVIIADDEALKEDLKYGNTTLNGILKDNLTPALSNFGINYIYHDQPTEADLPADFMYEMVVRGNSLLIGGEAIDFSYQPNDIKIILWLMENPGNHRPQEIWSGAYGDSRPYDNSRWNNFRERLDRRMEHAGIRNPLTYIGESRGRQYKLADGVYRLEEKHDELPQTRQVEVESGEMTIYNAAVLMSHIQFIYDELNERGLTLMDDPSWVIDELNKAMRSESGQPREALTDERKRAILENTLAEIQRVHDDANKGEESEGLYERYKGGPLENVLIYFGAQEERIGRLLSRPDLRLEADATAVVAKHQNFVTAVTATLVDDSGRNLDGILRESGIDLEVLTGIIQSEIKPEAIEGDTPSTEEEDTAATPIGVIIDAEVKTGDQGVQKKREPTIHNKYPNLGRMLSSSATSLLWAHPDNDGNIGWFSAASAMHLTDTQYEEIATKLGINLGGRKGKITIVDALIIAMAHRNPNLLAALKRKGNAGTTIRQELKQAINAELKAQTAPEHD